MANTPPLNNHRRPLNWVWQYYNREQKSKDDGTPSGIFIGNCKFCNDHKVISHCDRMAKHLSEVSYFCYIFIYIIFAKIYKFLKTNLV